MGSYKIDFNSFIERHPQHQKFNNNKVAKKIYELISEGRNIYKMMIFSQLELPALAACITEIEKSYSKQDIFKLDDSFCKQTMGVMVKDVLQPFGYDNVKSKDIPKGLSDFVNTAAVYDKLNDPTKILEKSFNIKDNI